MDKTVAMDKNTSEKELEKTDIYQTLEIKLERLWKVKITTMPVVIGAFWCYVRPTG